MPPQKTVSVSASATAFLTALSKVRNASFLPTDATWERNQWLITAAAEIQGDELQSCDVLLNTVYTEQIKALASETSKLNPSVPHFPFH